jgi:hypothetical protein
VIYLSGKLWGARADGSSEPGSAFDVAMKRDDFGVMMNPRHSSVYWKNLNMHWALDNGVFSKKGFSADAFRKMMDRPECLAAQDTCLFVVAPDKLRLIRKNESGKDDEIVGDPEGTIAQYRDWQREISARGYQVALVAQDRFEDYIQDVPWDLVDCIFLGGSTKWKLSAGARAVAEEANARYKWVHMGRVNSAKRTLYAHQIGCHSVDGTKLRFDPSAYGLATLLRGLDQIKSLESNVQDVLF